MSLSFTKLKDGLKARAEQIAGRIFTSKTTEGAAAINRIEERITERQDRDILARVTWKNRRALAAVIGARQARALLGANDAKNNEQKNAVFVAELKARGLAFEELPSAKREQKTQTVATSQPENIPPARQPSAKADEPSVRVPALAVPEVSRRASEETAREFTPKAVARLVPEGRQMCEFVPLADGQVITHAKFMAMKPDEREQAAGDGRYILRSEMHKFSPQALNKFFHAGGKLADSAQPKAVSPRDGFKSRAEFDAMTPSDKLEWCNDGGKVSD